jgi:hypothetical protein
VSAADTSSVRVAPLPETACTCECNCCSCCNEVDDLAASLRHSREECSRFVRERDDAYATLRRYDAEAAEEDRADGVVAVLAIIGGATVILALVCLAVLALRLAGGAS